MLEYSTAPKPFVFVLMPFAKEFDDVYKLGIKGAADEAGAYAERVDEQTYVEGTLDRILNQINKADVIVADVTTKNPNVFYEIGYAHALQKLVLLVTKDANDIPFDLRHRPHIVYGDKIHVLKEQLVPKLKWALAESQRAKVTPLQQTLLDVTILGHRVAEANIGEQPPFISGRISGHKKFYLPIVVRNASREVSPSIEYVYLVSRADTKMHPIEWVVPDQAGPSVQSISGLGRVPRRMRTINVPGTGTEPELRSRLDLRIPPLPTDAMEEGTINLEMDESVNEADEVLSVRLHSAAGTLEYQFRLRIQFVTKGAGGSASIGTTKAGTAKKKISRASSRKS